MSARRFAVFVATASVGLVAACNGILGIDEAAVDPSFQTDAQAARDVAVGTDGATGEAATDAPVSGAPCEAYCTAIMKNCTGQFQQYLSMSTCLAMCPNFEFGREGDTSGNSLACRITHAALAATNGPAVHCPHAGPLGADTCGHPCEGFCLLDVARCGVVDGGAAYADELDCRTKCAQYTYQPGSELTSESGDTLNCRLWHLETAYNPGLELPHCLHTAKKSDACFGPSDAGASDAKNDG